MIALLLIPAYILVNAYVVNWIFRWMGACSYIFQTLLFRSIFAGGYIFLATALLTGFLVRRPPALRRALKKTGNYFLGTFLYVLLGILVTDLGRILLKYVFHVSWIGSRTAFVITGGICTGLILCISIYGILRSRDLKTTPYEVTVKKQTGDMDSLKIVLLADTHFGYNTGSRHAARIAKQINQEKPDLVCIAGDIFDNEFEALQSPESIKKSLKSIQAKYGVYACWGNHDIDEPILAGFTFKSQTKEQDDPRMEQFLTECGIRLLDDESAFIADKFYLVGRRDSSRAEKFKNTRKTPSQLTAGLDKRKPIIFMDHKPVELQETADAGADLVLCGHTHGGQIFPGNLTIHLFWENPCGYLKKGSMHNIVTSGAGIWGPDMRVGTENEICSITVNFHPVS